MRLNLRPDVTLEQLHTLVCAMVSLRFEQDRLHQVRVSRRPAQVIARFELHVKAALDDLWEAQQLAA